MGSIEQTAASAAGATIIDIRSDTAGFELRKDILSGLNPADGGEKSLPTLLLYDDTGLGLFEKITYLDQYYLTEQEIEVLKQHAERIAARIPDGGILVELGSGNLRKVKVLLDALDRAGKRVNYYALDLMRSELERTLEAVPDGAFRYVKCFGLLGTYDDGLEWLKRSADQSKIILSLGSSIGNFSRGEAVGFVRQFAAILQPRDSLIFGIDACQDADRVFHAYNDRHGITHQFTLNGLAHANRLLGYQAFDPAVWETLGQYNTEAGRHEVFVFPKRDVVIEGVTIQRSERLRIEESYKYNRDQSALLWRNAGVIEGASWSNSSGDYSLHMVNRPHFMYPTKPELYAAHPVPSLNDWYSLWTAWDVVTRKMIPEEELANKPIKLRNACIFYLGHIPTFLDMKITEGTGGKPTEPSYFYKIFERGIDPDVDNPEHCHAHSEVPDSWPPLDEMVTFQDRVRARVSGFYKTGAAYNDAWIGRVLWLGFEHEIMHMETLLYMLLQSDKTLPPAGTVRPDFQQLAAQAQRSAVDNEWFDVPAQRINVGMEDPDNGEGPIRHFGWDVEKPSYTAQVPAFKAKGRPITVEEYAKYMVETGKTRLPASWVEFQPEGGDIGVSGATGLDAFLHGKAHRTVYGPVPLKEALSWPVSASYDELAGCAQYMGGRIPTLEEARSIYHYVDSLKKKEATNALGRRIPAVNGHLVNEGVEESPTPKPSLNGCSAAASLDPTELFVNLDQANVGFKHWHPMPVTQDGGKLAGLGEMGGVWEWTSSALEKQKGFEPMKLYPAYSVDFYDQKHNVVLGGSWATHPRLAGRKTFVNWYQRNYPYVWAGARMVKDS